MRYRAQGEIEKISSEREGLQYLQVRLADGSVREAISYPQYCGQVKLCDKVLLNCLAVEMKLGTGGYDFVLCVLNESNSEGIPPGHIFKQRYTPNQFPVLSVESLESPHHEMLKLFESLEGLPVVCCELHSQIPAVIAGIRSIKSG